MKTVVVYESHYGNTAAVAQAIAAGIGEGVTVLTTDEATAPALEGVDLIVAGAPVMVLRLPTDKVLAQMATDPKRVGADLSHPSMRDWLDRLPRGQGWSAAFETRLRWSPGGATGAIEKGLEAAGAPAPRTVRGRETAGRGALGRSARPSVGRPVRGRSGGSARDEPPFGPSPDGRSSLR